MLPQYTMTKLQNIKVKLQDENNKDNIRKLSFSLPFHRRGKKKTNTEYHANLHSF